LTSSSATSRAPAARRALAIESAVSESPMPKNATRRVSSRPKAERRMNVPPPTAEPKLVFSSTSHERLTSPCSTRHGGVWR
jgi:hypothetical protein